MTMTGKGRSKTKGNKGKRLRTIDRRPIRPLERQRMRPWLKDLLDNKGCEQAVWISREQQTFRVAWKHAAGQTFDPESDASLFELWARHTGKYYTGDKPDPKKWKANFRCALNSLPDVDEDRQQGVRRGNNAFKVYKFLEEKKTKKSSQKITAVTDEEDSEDDYSPKYKALGTKSRPKKVVQNIDLDSEGSETGSSPGRMDWELNGEVEREERSPLPKFDELCQPFSQPFDRSFSRVPTQRLPETHSPQASDDNDETDDHQDETCNGSPTDEEIVNTISDMLREQPQQFLTTVISIDSEAPDMYIDSAESCYGPSVIVETEDFMQDYRFTSLDLTQL